DVLEVRAFRPASGHGTAPGEDMRHDMMRRMNRNSVGFDIADKIAQQAIVTQRQPACQPWQIAKDMPAHPHLAQIGAALNPPCHYEMADALLPQFAKDEF